MKKEVQTSSGGGLMGFTAGSAKRSARKQVVGWAATVSKVFCGERQSACLPLFLCSLVAASKQKRPLDGDDGRGQGFFYCGEVIFNYKPQNVQTAASQRLPLIAFWGFARNRFFVSFLNLSQVSCNGRT